jgi:hypothetical protein
VIIDLYKYKKWKHANNLSKYYSLKMSRSTGKTKNENITFNLNGNIIKCEDEVKLLGVTINVELNFNTHIVL